MRDIWVAYITWALLRFMIPGPAFANGVEWIPLKELPPPDEIVAFSNRPATERDQRLSFEQLRSILRSGKLHSDYPSSDQILPRGEKVYANGVFISRKGMAYFWTMWDKYMLHIVNSEGRSCIVEVPGEGVTPIPDTKETKEDVYRKLAPLPAKQVKWFFNDCGPSTGGSLRRDKDEVLRYLRDGKPVPCGSVTDKAELLKDAWLTLPEERANLLRRFRNDMKGNALPRNFENQPFFQVQGMLATADGRILFWNQWSDHLLELRDENGGLCLLRIP